MYLLDLAKAEYSEGILDGGTIENNIEVQDADVFIKTSELILQNYETLHQKGNIFEKDFTDVIIKLENSEPSTDIDVLIDKIILEINQIEILQIDSEIMPEINYKEIPEWVKNIALWWATGEVNDEEFLQAIEYLINQGTIVVSNK